MSNPRSTSERYRWPRCFCGRRWRWRWRWQRRAAPHGRRGACATPTAAAGAHAPYGRTTATARQGAAKQAAPPAAAAADSTRGRGARGQHGTETLFGRGQAPSPLFPHPEARRAARQGPKYQSAWCRVRATWLRRLGVLAYSLGLPKRISIRNSIRIGARTHFPGCRGAETKSNTNPAIEHRAFFRLDLTIDVCVTKQGL